MSDGVRIALAIGYPKGFEPGDKQRKWPAVFSTCGYSTVVVPAAPAGYADRYVTVNASIRGTGVSGGALSPWSRRTWQDGYEIIENWIAKQPWSNRKVALRGYSWPGLVGFLTASTQPPSLKAVSVGGLADDFYRGIARRGGIRNCGFPIDWVSNYYRLDGPFGSGAAAMEARKLDASAYAKIVASRPERSWAQDTLWLGLHEVFDGPLWQQSSLCTHAPQIRAPIMIAHVWQDEQTGPTGWQLWNRVPEDVPKRLVLSNGHHGAGPVGSDETLAWFDHWLLDEPNPELTDPARRVLCYFETRKAPQGRGGVRGEPLSAAGFPLRDTSWTRYFLHGDRRLTTSAPGSAEAKVEYFVTHNDNGPAGRAVYEHKFPTTTAICGPLLLTLWAQFNTLDTDFYVLLADQAPDGTLFGLQRGLLRASHRAVDKERSTYAQVGGQRVLVQPFHPHAMAEPVAPHRPYEFLIEIPAVGHVFRPGHRMVLYVARPPEGDPIGVTRSGSPSDRYESSPPPAVVSILHDPQHASSLLVPVLPRLPPLAAQAVPLDEQVGLQPVR
jgi:predicted acyl esterase